MARKDSSDQRTFREAGLAQANGGSTTRTSLAEGAQAVRRKQDSGPQRLHPEEGG